MDSIRVEETKVRPYVTRQHAFRIQLTVGASDLWKTFVEFFTFGFLIGFCPIRHADAAVASTAENLKYPIGA